MEIIAGLLAVGLAAGFIILDTLWGGFVFYKLWGWFMVPIFGLNPITVAMAMGLALLASFASHQYTPVEKDAGKLILHAVLYPAITLLIGFCIHLLM